MFGREARPLIHIFTPSELGKSACENVFFFFFGILNLPRFSNVEVEIKVSKGAVIMQVLW